MLQARAACGAVLLQEDRIRVHASDEVLEENAVRQMDVLTSCHASEVHVTDLEDLPTKQVPQHLLLGDKMENVTRGCEQQPESASAEDFAPRKNQNQIVVAAEYESSAPVKIACAGVSNPDVDLGPSDSENVSDDDSVSGSAGALNSGEDHDDGSAMSFSNDGSCTASESQDEASSGEEENSETAEQGEDDAQASNRYRATPTALLLPRSERDVQPVLRAWLDTRKMKSFTRRQWTRSRREDTLQTLFKSIEKPPAEKLLHSGLQEVEQRSVLLPRRGVTHGNKARAFSNTAVSRARFRAHVAQVKRFQRVVGGETPMERRISAAETAMQHRAKRVRAEDDETSAEIDAVTTMKDRRGPSHSAQEDFDVERQSTDESMHWSTLTPDTERYSRGALFTSSASPPRCSALPFSRSQLQINLRCLRKSITDLLRLLHDKVEDPVEFRKSLASEQWYLGRDPQGMWHVDRGRKCGLIPVEVIRALYVVQLHSAAKESQQHFAELSSTAGAGNSCADGDHTLSLSKRPNLVIQELEGIVRRLVALTDFGFVVELFREACMAENCAKKKRFKQTNGGEPEDLLPLYPLDADFEAQLVRHLNAHPRGCGAESQLSHGNELAAKALTANQMAGRCDVRIEKLSHTWCRPGGPPAAKAGCFREESQGHSYDWQAPVRQKLLRAQKLQAKLANYQNFAASVAVYVEPRATTSWLPATACAATTSPPTMHMGKSLAESARRAHGRQQVWTHWTTMHEQERLTVDETTPEYWNRQRELYQRLESGPPALALVASFRGEDYASSWGESRAPAPSMGPVGVLQSANEIETDAVQSVTTPKTAPPHCHFYHPSRSADAIASSQVSQQLRDRRDAQSTGCSKKKTVSFARWVSVLSSEAPLSLPLLRTTSFGHVPCSLDLRVSQNVLEGATQRSRASARSSNSFGIEQVGSSGGRNNYHISTTSAGEQTSEQGFTPSVSDATLCRSQRLYDQLTDMSEIGVITDERAKARFRTQNGAIAPAAVFPNSYSEDVETCLSQTLMGWDVDESDEEMSDQELNTIQLQTVLPAPWEEMAERQYEKADGKNVNSYVQPARVLASISSRGRPANGLLTSIKATNTTKAPKENEGRPSSSGDRRMEAVEPKVEADSTESETSSGFDAPDTVRRRRSSANHTSSRVEGVHRRPGGAGTSKVPVQTGGPSHHDQAFLPRVSGSSGLQVWRDPRHTEGGHGHLAPLGTRPGVSSLQVGRQVMARRQSAMTEHNRSVATVRRANKGCASGKKTVCLYRNKYLGTTIRQTSDRADARRTVPPHAFRFLEEDPDGTRPPVGRVFHCTAWVVQRRAAARPWPVGEPVTKLQCSACGKWRKIDCPKTGKILRECETAAKFRCSDLIFCDCHYACDTTTPNRAAWGHVRDYRVWVRVSCCGTWKRLDPRKYLQLKRSGKVWTKPTKGVTCLDCGFRECQDLSYCAAGWHACGLYRSVNGTADSHFFSQDDDDVSEGEFVFKKIDDVFGEDMYVLTDSEDDSEWSSPDTEEEEPEFPAESALDGSGGAEAVSQDREERSQRSTWS
ncbi:unnamed protein product [Amoebophrya sp. A120]|nr:unnamed protein product [Amoebophrya sp. A120]|eukprot:GSA120T00015267001.1